MHGLEILDNVPCLIQVCVLLAWMPHVHACDQTKQFKSMKGNCCDLCKPGYFMKSECSNEKTTVCELCPADTFSVVHGYRSCKTCTTCQQVQNTACSSTADATCSCQKGYLCANEKCSKCREKPVCGRGEQVQRQGSFDYHYTCMPCPNDTFSDSIGGTCKPLAQCHQFGLEVISPGNSTHNTKCGCSRHEMNRYEIPAVHLTMIVLLVFALQLCSCLMGRYCMHNKQIASIMPAAGRANRRCRCPLSEEERGDFPGQLIDNKSNFNYQPSSIEQPKIYVVTPVLSSRKEKIISQDN